MAKISCKDKVQTQLKSRNSHPAWEGVKSMMGMNSKKCSISFIGKSGCELANDLNHFYNHFDVHDFSRELSVFKTTSSSHQADVHMCVAGL